MNPVRVLTVVLAMAGLWQAGSALHIPAKAWLAQQLIHHAWTMSQVTGEYRKPWSWADTMPVARLLAPEHDKDFIVMSGASGEALAFGPGHVISSDDPGSGGHIVIGGHRDTHFRFLKDAAQGQTLQLQDRDGDVHDYVVESISIVDITQQPLILAEEESLLTLVTCYPFDGLAADKSRRFVVTARGT